MKPRILLITLIISLHGLIIGTNALAQFKEFQLIEFETSVRGDVTTALHFFENKDAVTRFREVQLNDNIKSLFSVETEDQIILNLFPDITYLANIRQVEAYMDDNVTITAGIETFDYAYMIISTTGDRTLANIHIPELAISYQITSDPITNTHYLIELDPALIEKFDEYPSVIPPDPTPEEQVEINRIEKELEGTVRDTRAWYVIDVMIVYTPAAATWGNTNGGGIRNLIATAVATGQLCLSYSSTEVILRLVHNAQITYTESGNANTDLSRLRNTSDGYMDAVHTWRDTYGADLVQLFSTMSGGIGYLLTSTAGAPTYAFSIAGVSTATAYTPIHEMGHNMGCHHHKQQNFQPGPGLYTYSAGWRWTGTNSVRYCDLMTYESGSFFPDGLTHTRVPHFSNPSVNYWGVATGHASDGDNARTIRNIKPVIAAYRSTATINCIACPGYNFSISPNSSWQTSSSSIAFGGCKIYRFTAIAGRTYIFQTGCGNGATADFNTYLQLLHNNCLIITTDDNGCENGRSKIEWVATYDGYAYLVVRGYSATHYGSYTLAYQRPLGCNSYSQWPSGTLGAEPNWKYQSGIYAGEYSRFSVISGTTYNWSLCDFHGGDAPYDSQLTLRKASDNSILAYSDDECGTGMDAYISWTADFTGDVKVVISKFNCTSETTPTRLGYKTGTLVNPYVNITPSNRDVLSSAGSTTYNITSNTSWSLTKNVSWITSLSQTSGTGNATITVNYNANTGVQRVGTITASAFGISNVQSTLTQFPGNDAYCNSLYPFGGPLTPTDDWQYHTGIWAGEYVNVNVINGTQYHFSLCPEHGGSASYDSELTLRRADNNAFLAHSNDVCGDDARISWTATYTGLVKLVLTRFPCESQATSTRIAYKSGALVNIAVALTPENRDVLSGAGTTYFYVNSNTSWSLTKDVSWITSLTPSSGTGNATIAVVYTANTGAQRIGTITASSGAFSTQSTLTQMPNDAQCNSVNQWSGLLEPENTWKYLHGMWAGEYARFSVESGTQYHWSLCPDHGGNATYDSRLTLRNAETNAYITYNSYFCGDDGKITWNATYTGEVKVIVTVEPCGSNTVSTRLAYKKGTLANPSITISPVFRVVGPLGGSTTYNITSNTTWTLSSDQPWAVLSQTSGTGNATIIVNYDPNTGSDRMATFTGVASYGPTVTAMLSQYDYCSSGNPYMTGTPTDNWKYMNCIYGGEYATFPVNAGEKYNWSLCETHGANAPFESQLTLRKASDNSFIAYSYNNCGPGDNGAVIDWMADFTGNVRVYLHKYDCQAQNTCSRLGYKKGNLEQPFLTAAPDQREVGYNNGTTTFDLLSNTTNWTVTESIPWLSVVPVSGNGNGTLTVNYDANPITTPRSGEMTISAPYTPNVIVVVNQAGAPPFLTVLPPERNVSTAAGNTTFDVTSNTGWAVTESLPWLTVAPMNGSMNGTITVNYTENTALAARSGQIILTAFEAPDVIVTVNQAGVVIPVNVTVPPYTVAPGVYQCYNASQTITVQYYTILSGGMVNMVAGHNIRLLEGTHARSGSYLHAWISDVDHCDIISPPGMLAVKDEIITPSEQPEEIPTPNKFFKVYPNPTTGLFNLELAQTTSEFLVEIYSLLGEQILRQSVSGHQLYEFDLSGQPRGVYIVRVISGDEMGVQRVIRQ